MRWTKTVRELEESGITVGKSIRYQPQGMLCPGPNIEATCHCLCCAAGRRLHLWLRGFEVVYVVADRAIAGDCGTGS